MSHGKLALVASADHQGIFGNAELEELARVAAARCREELFTTRIVYGPMTAAQAMRVEQLQRIVTKDALWAMRELHAWDIRASIYPVLDACKVTRRRGDAARVTAAARGLLSTDLDGWVGVLNQVEDLERLHAGKR